jgi:hypothetical protein
MMSQLAGDSAPPHYNVAVTVAMRKAKVGRAE